MPSLEAGHEASEELTRILRDLSQGDAATVSLISRSDSVVMTVVTTRASGPVGVSRAAPPCRVTKRQHDQRHC